MRGHVDGRLDRDLQRVLDEALLAQVGSDPLRVRQGPQLADARLDARELLGDQVRVGHAPRFPPAR
jgi:hypothetical protein